MGGLARLCRGLKVHRVWEIMLIYVEMHVSYLRQEVCLFANLCVLLVL